MEDRSGAWRSRAAGPNRDRRRAGDPFLRRRDGLVVGRDAARARAVGADRPAPQRARSGHASRAGTGRRGVPHGPPAGRAVLPRRGRRRPGVDEDPSLAAVPLLVDGRAAGRARGLHYDALECRHEMLPAVEGLAAEVAPALTSMKLLAAAQRRTAEAQALADLMRNAAEAERAGRRVRLSASTRRCCSAPTSRASCCAAPSTGRPVGGASTATTPGGRRYGAATRRRDLRRWDPLVREFDPATYRSSPPRACGRGSCCRCAGRRGRARARLALRARAGAGAHRVR